ncbi:hypothetical protein [Streptococcus intermedius]|uniref:hypothetical protein n=1 Tax=Streptococcus intermedius TaxID=1338 RepID=UPI000E3E1263|nr:hypothetical protein [Streptococcus intermedius]
MFKMFQTIRQSWEGYKESRKAMMKAQRDYFASDEVDEEREKERARRNQEFLQELKKWGIGCGIFLLVYLMMRFILGL